MPPGTPDGFCGKNLGLLAKGQEVECVEKLYLESPVFEPIKHVLGITIGANTKVMLAHYTHNSFV